MRILLLVILNLAMAILAETTVAARLVKLESIGFDEVCGLDADGGTACIAGGEPTVVPDSIGSITHGFANDILSCAIDNRAVKCWKQVSGAKLVEGKTVPAAVRGFLEVVKIETVRTSPNGICGEVKLSGELYCIVPDWRNLPTRAFRIKPSAKLTAIDIDSNLLCWADGTSALSKISCYSDWTTWKMPSDMQLNGLTELKVRANWICARSKTEGRCWSESGTAVLPADIITAKNWVSTYEGLCGLTRDSRVICVDPTTGSILPASLGHSIPIEYTTPNPDAKQLWSSDAGACVVHNSGIVNCWNWWNPTANLVAFNRPVVELFGSSYNPCAKLDNGQAECRLNGSYDSRTLKDTDRIRVAFGGWNKCFWNSSGVDCRGRVEDFAYQLVKDFANSTDGETICAVGVRTNDPANIDTVRCSSYNAELKAPPHELLNPTAVATNADQACALSDEGLTCWGAPYLETLPPKTVVQPKRLVMSSRHGCVLDQFGLACWGELNALDLTIPSGLDQPGRVIDVAVGASRTCAVLDNGSVECWGRDYELSGPPPPLVGATSILGRGGLFCALDTTGLHCWGGNTKLPK